ncbi:translation-associated GTPase [Pontivivens ytuae]|uniref:Translation-associated GTPase n=1 Tax=Pontivivens ytuae TaxID=2789856 RepID=A0A7S9LUY7_9RHOB|nr:translation-associated GTPase [Pontivivens ytuae]QPH55633.1 translation-associated GTPase [Pontivivens ytuae]
MPGAILVVGAALVSWSILLVVSRIILVNLALDPWLFTFIQMMAGGLFLMLASGRTRGVWRTLGEPITWLYGFLRVATAAFFTAALLHTTTANAAFLAIVSVPTSVLVVWLVMSRTPRRAELPGHLIILAGLLLLAASLEGGFRNPALILMLLSELCVVLSTLIAELHPQNQTDDRRQRAALTGAMLLASAGAMLAAVFALGMLSQAFPGLTWLLPNDLAWIADPTVLLDPALWVAAILVGTLLRGPSMFLALMAIHRVKTTNYLAGMAALPLTSMLFEAVAAEAGWLPFVSIITWSTGFGALMILGSLAVSAAHSQRPAPARAHVVGTDQRQPR